MKTSHHRTRNAFDSLTVDLPGMNSHRIIVESKLIPLFSAPHRNAAVLIGNHLHSIPCHRTSPNNRTVSPTRGSILAATTSSSGHFLIPTNVEIELYVQQGSIAVARKLQGNNSGQRFTISAGQKVTLRSNDSFLIEKVPFIGLAVSPCGEVILQHTTEALPKFIEPTTVRLPVLPRRY